MWIKKDEQFLEEEKKFNFKACCEDCRFFCDKEKKCAMLYPVTAHLRETFAKAQNGDRIYFCKMFEAS